MLDVGYSLFGGLDLVKPEMEVTLRRSYMAPVLSHAGEEGVHCEVRKNWVRFRQSNCPASARKSSDFARDLEKPNVLHIIA